MRPTTMGRATQPMPPASQQGARSALEIMRFLIPDLRTTLASLADAPQAVAQATVQLLPLGSRMSLEALGLAVWNDKSGQRVLVLTALAFEVAAELAAAAEYDSTGFTDWTERARHVMGERQSSTASD